MNEEQKPEYFGQNPKDQEYFVKKSLKWDGWGSPIGLGFFLVSLGLLLYFLNLAGII